jgi:hypothetical protein
MRAGLLQGRDSHGGPPDRNAGSGIGSGHSGAETPLSLFGTLRKAQASDRVARMIPTRLEMDGDALHEAQPESVFAQSLGSSLASTLRATSIRRAITARHQGCSGHTAGAVRDAERARIERMGKSAQRAAEAISCNQSTEIRAAIRPKEAKSSPLVTRRVIVITC